MNDENVKELIREMFKAGIITDRETIEKERRKLKIETWRVKRIFQKAYEEYLQRRK